jgi:hypothetical protein
VDPEVPVEGGDPVGQAAQPRADGVGAADPVVADLDQQATAPPPGADADRRGTGVLGGVGERLAGDVVGGLLHRGREPVGRDGGDGDGDRRALGQRRQRWARAGLAEDHRVDAARQLAQLRERQSQLGDRLVERRGEVLVRGTPELGVGDAEGQREVHQPLLGAVVQVALDPAAFGVPELHDAGAGGADLLELRTDLGLQALVLDGHARRRRHRADRRGVVVGGGVVEQGGDRGEAAPPRPGRPAPADHHDPEQQRPQRHVRQVGDGEHHVAVRTAVADGEQVLRAAGAAGPVRVHQQQLDHGQGHRGGIVGDDEHPLQPGGGAAVREDGEQVGDDARGQGVREVPERERGRGGEEDHAVGEQAERGIAQPDHDHQRAGPVLGPARPGDEAGRDERPAHPEDREQQVGERPRPVVAGAQQQRQVHQSRGQGREGEHQAQPRVHLIRSPPATHGPRARTAPPWG